MSTMRIMRIDEARAAGGAKTSCTSESSSTSACPGAQVAFTPSTEMAYPCSGM